MTNNKKKKEQLNGKKKITPLLKQRNKQKLKFNSLKYTKEMCNKRITIGFFQRVLNDYNTSYI